MAANNGTHFVGVIARQPEIKGKMARLSLAVRREMPRDGEPDVDFVPLTLLGEKVIDFAQKYLQKGRWIAVQARYRTFQYTKGEDVVYGHEFVVDQSGLTFVGPKVDGDDGSSAAARPTGSPTGASASRGAAVTRNSARVGTGRAAEPLQNDDDDVPF